MLLLGATPNRRDPDLRMKCGSKARLSPERQRNLLRYAVRSLRRPLPPAGRLEQILVALIPAKGDAEPLVAWDGVEVRRYRDELFILDERRLPSLADATLAPAAPVSLGPGLGTLELEQSHLPGIRSDIAERGMSVGFRAGGERLRPHPGARTKRLKNLLQSDGVLPWMRGSIPLLFDNGELVAAADLWVNADFQAVTGYRVVWRDRPMIY